MTWVSAGPGGKQAQMRPPKETVWSALEFLESDYSFRHTGGLFCENKYSDVLNQNFQVEH